MPEPSTTPERDQPSQRLSVTPLASSVLLLVAASSLLWFGLELIDALRGPGVEIGVRVPWDAARTALGQLPVPPGAGELSGGGYESAAELAIPALPLGYRLLASAGALLSDLAWFVGALYGWRVLSTVGAGTPFTRRNAGRLVRIAGLVLLSGAGAPWLTWWGDRQVLTLVGVDRGLALLNNPAGSSDIGLSALFVALVTLAGAEAFRRGRKLAEDTDGLV